MNEIKFRYVLKHMQKEEYIMKVFNLDDIEMGIIEDGVYDDIAWYNSLVARNIFTGHHDKHGKEIYEGDIVRDNEGYLNDVEERIGRIVWSNKYGYEMGFYIDSIKGTFYDYDGCTWSAKKSEVIGNVYENPELLKDSQKEGK